MSKATLESVLLIDDDHIVRMLIERKLKEAGIELVEQAASGEEALEILRKGAQQFQLILSDLKMPGTDGIGLLRDVCTLAPGIPLGFISSADAEIMRSAERLAIQRGVSFVGCLSKPVTRALLDPLLERAVTALERGPVAITEKPDWSGYDRPWLKRMLEQNRLCAYVQPQVRLSDGGLHGVEVLARIELEGGTPLPPICFIPLAEKSGLIDELTFRMVSIVQEAQKIWREDGLNLRVSVNFAASTLSNLSLLDRLSDGSRSEADLHNFVVEITESSAAEGSGDLLDVATRLRLNGVHLSVDDFGTGYSSLTQLSSLPYSELKLDQSFVQAAVDDPSSRKIVENTLRLAHDLGLQVVAEGVETERHWRMVRDSGCDLAQGYFIARPMPWQELQRWAEVYVPPQD